MNQKRINQWIPDAIRILSDDIKINRDKNGIEIPVPKAFKGYFSSFGAAVVQSGILPAVIFFENETGRTEANRPHVIEAVLKLLQAKGEIPSNVGRLTTHLLNPQNQQELQKPIVEAAIALKIALRTFTIEKDKNDESE